MARMSTTKKTITMTTPTLTGSEPAVEERKPGSQENSTVPVQIAFSLSCTTVSEFKCQFYLQHDMSVAKAELAEVKLSFRLKKPDLKTVVGGGGWG